MQCHLSIIENDLQSDNPCDCVYAIRTCCIQNVFNDNIIKIMKELKKDKRVAMMNKVSDFATAALDILGIEKYNGNNVIIIEMIETIIYNK